MKPQPSRALLGSLGILLSLALLLPFPIASAEGGMTFVVQVPEDGVDVSPGDRLCASAAGVCTLRAAVMEANALETADRIELGPWVHYLSIGGLNEEGAATGDLDILDDLELVGFGIYYTLIEAGGEAFGDRALHVHPEVVFRMTGVGVANARIGAGANGAGLRNDGGDVEITDAAFQYNQAHNGAGLMNVGQMVIRRSLIWGNEATDSGAGIRNDGSLEVYDSMIGGNQAAGPGGGIQNHGTLDLWNSTLSANRATNRAAAIYNGYPLVGGTVRLRLNSDTIFANLVKPDGTEFPSTGGIYTEPGSPVLISNTILSGNGAADAYANCWGEISSGGHNLLGVSSDCTISGDATGNLYDIDEPGLDPLMGEGAPTHALRPGSPAIDAGKPAPAGGGETDCPAADQRGVSRPQGTACDIGAYELEVGPGFTPTTTVTLPSTTYTPTATASPPPEPRVWTATIPGYSALFGYSVSGAGDVNADDLDDVLVGARDYGERWEGGAFLYLGAEEGPGTTADWVVESNQAYAVMGCAVSSAGDVNADGFDDVLVSACLYTAGQTSEGAVFAYYGSPSGLSTTPDWMAEGNQASAYFGWSISAAGDVNRDGFDDVVIGARHYSGGQAEEGKAYVYLGSASGLQATPAWQHEIDVADAGFGYSVSGAGDVNGDGYDDILVGSYNYIYGTLNGGNAYLFLGSASGIVDTPAWIGSSGTSLDGYGYTVARAGDVNADGFGDMLVTAPGGDTLVEGKAYLYYGSAAGPSSTPAWIGSDGTASTRFGSSAAGSCDINNDGFDDFVVGDPNDRGGKVHFYLGGPDGPPASSSWWVDPPGSGDAGHSTGRGGNIDRDGYCDVLVGNPMYGNGYAYLYFGYAAAPGIPTVTPSPSPLPSNTPTPTPTSTPTPSPTPIPGSLFFDGFETGDLTAWSSAQTDSGDLRVSAEAALGGAFGMRAVVDDNRAIYVVDTSPTGEGTYAARFYFDPNAIVMASGNAHVIFKAMDAASRTAFQVELRFFQGDYQMRAYAPWDSGGAYNSPWFRIGDDWHQIEVLWQAASADGAADGWLVLSVDEEAVASGVGIDNDTRRVDSVRLGAVAGIDTGTRGTTYFDAFGSAAGGYIGSDPAITLPSAPPLPDAIFADGFESGDLSAWSARKNETDLLVAPGSALVGAYGLQAVADDTTPRYVTDWTPVAEREYHVRFVFDPNSLTMLDGRSHLIFQALAGTSKVVARVELRYKSLNYEVRSGVLTDDNKWVNTSWWYVDDAPQVMELEWRAASSPASADGRLVMWINEVQSEAREGIANFSLSVDLTRLGLVAGVDTGTLGSMNFDAFESRRYSYIGLPGEEPTPMPSGTPTVTRTPTATPTP